MTRAIATGVYVMYSPAMTTPAYTTARQKSPAALRRVRLLRSWTDSAAPRSSAAAEAADTTGMTRSTLPNLPRPSRKKLFSYSVPRNTAMVRTGFASMKRSWPDWLTPSIMRPISP